MDADGEMLSFRLIRSAQHVTSIGPRLGQLSMPARKSIDTPHYVAISSRGVVPHLSQDTMRQHTNIEAVHVGLEDCERHSISGALDVEGADSGALTGACKL